MNRNFEVTPALYPLHQECNLTITAREPAFFPWEGKKYDVHIQSLQDHNDGYYAHKDPVFNDFHTTVKAHNGAIVVPYTFKEESIYLIELVREEKLLAKLYVYALEDDLYNLRPLKGDFHIHSYRSDGSRCPQAQPGHYREQGYDFMFLTDHNRRYSSFEAQEAYAKVKLGMKIYNGEEVHTPGSLIHIVHAGGKESVAEQYYDMEKYEAEWQTYMDKLPKDLPEGCEKRYAKAMWESERARKAGGLNIFPHPFWIPGNHKSYNVETKFAKYLLKSGLFDAFEVFGGMKTEGNNFTALMLSELRAEGLNMPVVGSSDVHELNHPCTFPRIYTIVFAKENSEEAIVEAVKKGYSVAVQWEGYEGSDGAIYNCYGDLRLVFYTRFLIDNYFNRVKELVACEGVAMRNYIIGVEDGKLLNQMAGREEAFYNRFSGKSAPILPKASLRKNENKWRRVQMESPVAGAGSSMLAKGGSSGGRQI